MLDVTLPNLLSSRELIDRLADPDTFQAWDEPLGERDHPGFTDVVAKAQGKTGLDESVVTGKLMLSGHALAVIMFEFEFIGGTVGVAAARRMVEAIQRATRERLPLLICTASGGTRVTEGSAAFVTMLSISAALEQHKASQLLVISYLRHPTLGGAYASWASMGHVSIAEPEARIGFLGPKVHGVLSEAPIPAGIQQAENLVVRRHIDRIAAGTKVRETIADLLDTMAPEAGTAARADEPVMADPFATAIRPAWDYVRNSRNHNRPSGSDVLRLGWDKLFFLDDQEASGVKIRIAIAAIRGHKAIVLAQKRRSKECSNVLQAADFTYARRGIKMAHDLGLPLVTLVDTPGADSSESAENQGIGREIALTISELTNHRTPIVSVLLGEGTGGGAIALMASDVTLAAQNSWLAPLPPEGISAIVYGGSRDSLAAAELQKLSPEQLRCLNMVDRIIPERPDAAVEATSFSRRLAAAIATELEAMAGREPGELVMRRHDRLLSLTGAPSSVSHSCPADL